MTVISFEPYNNFVDKSCYETHSTPEKTEIQKSWDFFKVAWLANEESWGSNYSFLPSKFHGFCFHSDFLVWFKEFISLVD